MAFTVLHVCIVRISPHCFSSIKLRVCPPPLRGSIVPPDPTRFFFPRTPPPRQVFEVKLSHFFRMDGYFMVPRSSFSSVTSFHNVFNLTSPDFVFSLVAARAVPPVPLPIISPKYWQSGIDSPVSAYWEVFSDATSTQRRPCMLMKKQFPPVPIVAARSLRGGLSCCLKEWTNRLPSLFRPPALPSCCFFPVTHAFVSHPPTSSIGPFPFPLSPVFPPPPPLVPISSDSDNEEHP